jgi:hypothetical protein
MARHVEHMRKHGLRVPHAMNVPEFTVPCARCISRTRQQLAKEKPVDIAFVCEVLRHGLGDDDDPAVSSPNGYVVSCRTA